MSTVYVMCGVSGSGKTTWAQNFIEMNPQTCYISTDKIRGELWGDENDQRSPDVVFQTAYGRLDRRVNLNQDVIFDATNLRARDRKRLIKRVRQLNDKVKLVCIVMSVDLEECIQRQQNRERQVPRNVITNQYVKMQYPFPDEGWDEIRIIETLENKKEK